MNCHMLDWSGRGNRPTSRICRLVLLASGLLSLFANVGHTEGLPVKDALFAVKDGEAKLVAGSSVQLANGGFEDFSGNKLAGFRFHDRPGEVSFVDTQVNHSGQASLRMENFGSDPHGHGRVMQEVPVQPNRCYRLQIWVKTQALSPVSALKVQVLASNRALAPRELSIPATSDWRRISMLFNSLDFATVRLYAGVWGGDMGELLGQCITKQVQILRRHLPGAEIYIWSDMLDPHHNAHGDYYLVDGDFTGSWKHVPKDLIIAVWGGSPRDKSLRFFADEGFQTLAACYYDADDLEEVKGWLRLARQTPNVRGLMYTPWQKKYALLPQFGALLNSEP